MARTKRAASPSSEIGTKPRVAAIVFNRGLTDVRVIKEAESLASNGYDVHVFGLGPTLLHGTTPNGVPVTVIPRAVIRADVVTKLAQRAGITALLFAIVNGLALYSVTPDRIQNTIVIIANLTLLFIFLLIIRQLYLELFKATPAEKGTSTMEMAAARLSGWSRRLQKNLFVKALEPFKPDIVHCHDLPTTPIGWYMRRRHGTAFVYDSHELWTEQAGLPASRRKLDRLLEERVVRQVNRIITVNESIAAELQVRYPDTLPAVVIRNAAKPATKPIVYDGRLHRLAGLDPSRRVLLFQGGLANGRGLTILIESIIDLPEDWSIVFLGSGAAAPALKERADQVLLDSGQEPDRIRFIPPVPWAYLPAFTAGATLGIIPYENISLNNWLCTPNKLWEYPVAGVPILASPFPEMSKVVNDYGIGWLLDDPLTYYSIVDKIRSLTSRDLQMARDNCEKFIATDNWTVYERRLVGLYAELEGRDNNNSAA